MSYWESIVITRNYEDLSVDFLKSNATQLALTMNTMTATSILRLLQSNILSHLSIEVENVNDVDHVIEKSKDILKEFKGSYLSLMLNPSVLGQVFISTRLSCPSLKQLTIGINGSLIQSVSLLSTLPNLTYLKIITKEHLNPSDGSKIYLPELKSFILATRLIGPTTDTDRATVNECINMIIMSSPKLHTLEIPTLNVDTSILPILFKSYSLHRACLCN